MNRSSAPKFGPRLVSWYAVHKRDFPWRRTRDPYKIWVSEIMLQQTRTEVVRDYYVRFLKEFPTVARLARADLEQVLRIWQGLGYYSRAKNLHAAARIVTAKHRGRLPPSFQEIHALPGIGQYTAGAILSIAFGKPIAAIDGNVIRVMTRLLRLSAPARSKPVLTRIEEGLRRELDQCDPSEFNQALMDLASMVCTPRSPLCATCPVRKFCRARAANLQSEIPRNDRQASAPVLARTVAVIEVGGKVLMAKRPEKGLLAGFWEFPGVNARTCALFRRRLAEEYGLRVKPIRALGRISHVFSHQVWDMRVIQCSTDSNPNDCTRPARLVSWAQLEKIPLPKAIRSIADLAQSK